jgi:hypothetical protein
MAIQSWEALSRRDLASVEGQICAVPQDRYNAIGREPRRGTGAGPGSRGAARVVLLRFGLVVAGVRHEAVGNYTGL